MTKLPKEIQKELDAAGVDYEIKTGKRHRQIIIEGKFCAVLPLAGFSEHRSLRSTLNIRAQVRRRIKALKR